jgi:multidrug efflux pump subunit AcrB
LWVSTLASFGLEQREAMLRTVEIENRPFVITSLTKNATVLPLLCLKIVSKPFRNFGINPVFFG